MIRRAAPRDRADDDHAHQAVRRDADDEADVGDVYVTLCVHAGIAAADVLCSNAGYSSTPVSADQRKRAGRAAERLVDAIR